LIIEYWNNGFPLKKSILHDDSSVDRGPWTADSLIIDNVGMLSKLYYYSSIAFIGGGFTKDGIHNILEAAVYGKPIVFGPNYRKYREARELVGEGGAFSVGNAEELAACLKRLMEPEALRKAGEVARKYVQKNTGATAGILQFIQENRLLTR
jgi:3-deoxy-D-manno-octulosonic-acid transferase